MNSHETADAGLRCPCCNQRFPAEQTGWQGRCWKCLGFASPEDFAVHRQGHAVVRKMPPTKPPANPLEAEIADTLVKIEGNYVRETSGYGSRFEGERLEVVQARWAIRRVREADGKALAAIADRTSPCPPPAIADGYSDCHPGKVWPCTDTEIAWLARGLDPREQVAKAIADARAQMYDPGDELSVEELIAEEGADQG